MQKLNSKIDQKENQIIFQVNSKIYPLEAIYSTAYVFINQAYIYLDGDPAKEITVYLKGKEKLDKKQLTSLSGEFQNELLNYLLRCEITKRNKKVRDFIVGTALLSALPNDLLVQSSLTKKKEVKRLTIDKKDPLGIVKEEKHGKKRKVKKKK